MNRTTFRAGMVASVAAVILVGAGVGAYAVSRGGGDEAPRPAMVDEATGEDGTTAGGSDTELTLPDGTGPTDDRSLENGDGDTDGHEGFAPGGDEEHRAGPPAGDGPAMLPPDESRVRGERPERDDEDGDGGTSRGDTGYGRDGGTAPGEGLGPNGGSAPNDGSTSGDDDTSGTPELAQPST